VRTYRSMGEAVAAAYQHNIDLAAGAPRHITEFPGICKHRPGGGPMCCEPARTTGPDARCDRHKKPEEGSDGTAR
jgi:hypothetical protein